MCIRDRLQGILRSATQSCWSHAAQNKSIFERLRRAQHIAELQDLKITMSVHVDGDAAEADEFGREACSQLQQNFHTLVEQNALGYTKTTLGSLDKIALYAVYDLPTRSVAVCLCSTGSGVVDGCEVAMDACRALLGHSEISSDQGSSEEGLQGLLERANTRWEAAVQDRAHAELARADQRSKALDGAYDESTYAEQAVSPRHTEPHAGTVLYMALVSSESEGSQSYPHSEPDLSTAASIAVLSHALQLASSEHVAQVLETSPEVLQRVAAVLSTAAQAAPEGLINKSVGTPLRKEGMLDKLAGGMSGGWKQKKVALKDNHLVYSPPDSPSELKTLHINKFVSVDTLPPVPISTGLFGCAASGGCFYPFRIVSKTNKGVHRKTYEFRCGSEDELHSWLAAIDQIREANEQAPLSPGSTRALATTLDECGLEEAIVQVDTTHQEPADVYVDSAEIELWLATYASNLKHHARMLVLHGFPTVEALKRCSGENLGAMGMTPAEQRQLALTVKSVLLLPPPPGSLGA
eukprot:TRINITY_DN13699_c0_g1_i2.p1 TRINITY_DN13699_c0_g1~~TRINITY_DN13699_c0_g1_i2.p1  ORF type:complete len:523 (-),score=119.49 TRINITY_DN13699_c0_g1_i2:150-1718(-)